MIFVALGANLPSRFGAPHETLAAAKDAMAGHGIHIKKSSETFLTAPVPLSDQPWYHNAVVHVETELSPFRLLEVLQDIENDFGRVRTVRNAPRILDLDLIAYNDVILDKPALPELQSLPELIVPHPRMHERAFVLLPMQEIIKDWTHPVLNRSLSDLVALLPSGQAVQRLEEAEEVA